MKHIVAALFVALVNASAVAAEMSEEQKTFYALGQIMARPMNVLSLTSTELGLVKQGMTDAVDSKKPAIDMDVYGPKAVSYTHLRAHETVLDLVCRLLLEKKKKATSKPHNHLPSD